MRAAWTLFHDIHRFVLSILLLTGSPFVLIGGAEAWQVWQQLLSYPEVTGTVVDNDYRATDDGGGAYYPIVAFTPIDGQACASRLVCYRKYILDATTFQLYHIASAASRATRS